MKTLRSVVLLLPVVFFPPFFAGAALERPRSFVRSLHTSSGISISSTTTTTTTDDLKFRIEALGLEQQRELETNATVTPTSIEIETNSTTGNSTFGEDAGPDCKVCDPLGVKADKGSAETEEEEDDGGGLFSIILNVLASFLSGGGDDGGGFNLFTAVLDGLAQLFGIEQDNVIYQLISSVGGFLGLGAGIVLDTNPFISLLRTFLGVVGPLYASADSIIVADGTSNFKVASFGVFSNVTNAMIGLTTDAVDVDVKDKGALAGVTIALLYMIADVALFGIETVVVTTGEILEVGVESFTVENFTENNALLKNATAAKVDSILAVYDELKDDIAADGANATLILSNAEQAVLGFPQKVDFFLDTAVAAQAEGSVTAVTVNEITIFITELLNGIISLLSGIVTTVIDLIDGIAGSVYGVIVVLIDAILIQIAGIISATLAIFGLGTVAVSSAALRELSITVGLLEGPMTLSELAACRTDQEGCPKDATKDDVTCQVDYLVCVNDF